MCSEIVVLLFVWNAALIGETWGWNLMSSAAAGSANISEINMMALASMRLQVLN